MVVQRYGRMLHTAGSPSSRRTDCPLSNIFCETSRGLAGALRYSDIRVLLECANKSSFASDSLNDEILMAAIKVLASHSKETKQVEKLVNLLRNERSKIKALVQCGKLKNAYLTAIKSRLVDEVVNISQIAEKAGQLPVRDICEKWLQANGIPRRT
ncbi:Zinc finger FYVE domain-containing protein 26 [Geodia barretti]|uniref:Zinc finger FYVE domain-containing protein 26 n=1 Tax=Geodia barretti TaxID=519541 RepID=A0AA35R444_GEOBA|nr:Zinc finger FYVE domain-containing protein 26 [Geodia barretti]